MKNFILTLKRPLIKKRPLNLLILITLLFFTFDHQGPSPAAGSSLRFFGNGVNDIDRVKIPVDDPPTPIDIGDDDFTIEFWMRALPGENNSGICRTGNDNWIVGNIIVDRDVNGPGDYGDFGIAMFNDAMAFGVRRGTVGDGLCGVSAVADGAWHHIAATRRISDGYMQLFVDGVLEGSVFGPVGDVSYRDGRLTGYVHDPFLAIGAEKHDAGVSFPSFSGWIDEMRFSNSVRYTANFSPPSQPFSSDQNTVALYHFDEGQGIVANDSSGAAGGPTNGVLRVGGSPVGPIWTTETPFGTVESTDLAIRKVVSNTVPDTGNVITYTIRLENNGPLAATNIVVTDRVPTGLTYSQGSTSGGTSRDDSDPSGGGLRWTIDNLSNGANTNLSFQAVVETGADGRLITNLVSKTQDQNDNNATIDILSANIFVGSDPVTDADFVVSHSVSNATPREGDTIDYTITLTNNGPAPVSSITVIDIVPDGLSYVPGSILGGDGRNDSDPSVNGLNWSITTIGIGISADLSFQATVDAGTDGTAITNTVSKTQNQNDINITDDTLSSVITVGSTITPQASNGGGGGGGGGCFAQAMLVPVHD